MKIDQNFDIVIGLDFGGDSSDDEEETSNLFINHMRKCFIAIDDDRSCEYVLVPEVEKDYKTTKKKFFF